LCFACRTPLTAEEKTDQRYVENVSCPYCFKATEEQQEQQIKARHAAIRTAVTPLPGSVPYDQARPLNVPEACDRGTILDCLCEVMSHISREEWLAVCEAGSIVTDDHTPVSAQHIVRAGERYRHLKPAQCEPEVNADIRVLFEDEAIIVLNKPAPLPVHACGRFNRNTLQFILNVVWHPLRPRSVHRLDANTTGVTVLCKTRHFASLVQPQFEHSEVEKHYLARVQGHPPHDEFTCDAPVSAEAGKLGGRTVDEAGLAAHTEFRVLTRDADGTALLLARPLTGRTNQIRVHLWHLGFPVCGDPTYLPEKKVAATQTLDCNDEPMLLHAWRLSCDHPHNGQRLTFEDERPAWAVVPF
jgi:RluA family pseudouridine synthase